MSKACVCHLPSAKSSGLESKVAGLRQIPPLLHCRPENALSDFINSMAAVSVALPSFDFRAELLQRLFLNLPDALAGDAEMLADDFK
jgi:hypothetical protein